MWNIYNIEQKQNVDCLQHRAKAGSGMSTTYCKIECGISTTQSRRKWNIYNIQQKQTVEYLQQIVEVEKAIVLS